jgi:hypothetical protein
MKIDLEVPSGTNFFATIACGHSRLKLIQPYR